MEEKTSRPTAFARIASSSARVPATLVCQYRSGCSTDSATSARAAKCSTPSYAGAVREHRRRGVGDVAVDQPGAVRHRVRVPGGQVVEHGHLVPGTQQVQGDDAADVAGATGDEQPHGPPPPPILVESTRRVLARR